MYLSKNYNDQTPAGVVVTTNGGDCFWRGRKKILVRFRKLFWFAHIDFCQEVIHRLPSLKDDDRRNIHDEWMSRCDISDWKFGGSFQLVILVNSGAYWCHCETPKKSKNQTSMWHLDVFQRHIPTHIPAALPRDEMRQQVRSEKVELYEAVVGSNVGLKRQ